MVHVASVESSFKCGLWYMLYPVILSVVGFSRRRHSSLSSRFGPNRIVVLVRQTDPSTVPWVFLYVRNSLSDEMCEEAPVFLHGLPSYLDDFYSYIGPDLKGARGSRPGSSTKEKQNSVTTVNVYLIHLKVTSIEICSGIYNKKKY
jgi:hypothetical protein